jgi:hypothetical protein
MATTINASTSSGLAQTADTSGTLELQSNGTTQLTVSSTGVSASNTFKMNSGYGSVANAYGCRAWVNFNGIGTIAIRNSANVTSITDNGVGDYTVNLTTAMPDSSYTPCASSDANSGLNFSQPVSISTGSFQITTRNGAGTYFDATTVSAAVFR